MRIQELIILGILKEHPRHGYEIKKIIKKELGIFASLENKSIYYPLKQMEQRGLIKKTTDEPRGKILRYVYAITPAGSKVFINLAMHALLSEKRPFIDIDIPLYFLPFLEKKEVLARLRLRKRFLEKVKSWLAGNLEARETFPVHQALLLKHHLNLLNAEEGFVEDIIRIIKKQ
ncbi:MAG: helix-turn-helix transcriptional regulator [Candidatus Omnitrophica bacterium]|nr:helix-turn-helix transcriptional regulator [Candidatus Omnitrophota bacterium]